MSWVEIISAYSCNPREDKLRLPSLGANFVGSQSPCQVASFTPAWENRAAMGKHRLYIDEVGNSDLGASSNENHRYLSLTGVIMSLDYAREALHPLFEDMKRRYFASHPDDPVIFHRKELCNQRAPFEALADRGVREEFDRELMGLIGDGEYTVITVVIDKLEHLSRYEFWQEDPYHYCLKVMLERYTLWLRGHDLRGDVMAESRGGKEDRRLKLEYTRIFRSGTENIPHTRFLERLTSSQLKVRPKSANVAGLQFADLIAHPSHVSTKARRHGKPLPDNYGGRVAAILEATKYRRGYQGRIWGYGRKWLP